MKANELRIGNYLEYKTKEIVQATGVLSHGVFVDKGVKFKGCLSFFQFKPIPITEEWLLKFGFEKGTNFDGWFIYGKIGFNKKDEYYYWDSFDYAVELKHVHQLQNLYFALTNEELTT